MSFKARSSVAFVAALLALATLSGALAQAQIGGQSIIVNPRPGDLQVFLSVDRDPAGRGNPTYNIGDPIAINVSVNHDAYVYVFSVRSDGVVTLILPNGFTENPLLLRGGRWLIFPRPGDAFSLSVAGPPGVDRVLALASVRPLSIEDIASVGSDEIATADVEGADDLARALAIIVNPIPSDGWATATATFTVAVLVPVPPRPLPIQGTLSIDSSPRGAQIFVNGALRGVTPARIDLQPGSYELRVRLPGYEEFVSTVNIRAGSTTSVNALLQPVVRSGTLSVDSSPRGAQVHVNGIFRGVTPLRIDLDPAQYDVRVTLTGYEEFAANVNVRPGQVSSVSARLQPVPRTGTLQVVANVAGAEVWLDNSRIGISPLNTTLNEGAYLVRVRAAGFEEFQIRVAIQVGRVTRVDAILRALAGSLRVIGAPEGAYVFIDGAAVGRVAGGILEVSGVAAGRREVTVIAPGYRTSISQVNVAADRRVDVRVSLTPL